MSATPDSTLANPEQRIADLERQLAEARQQQAATADILEVINSSPGDLAPVFDAILEKAHTLCGAAHGALMIFDGEEIRVVAAHGEPRFVEAFRQMKPIRPPRERLAPLMGGPVHLPDAHSDPGSYGDEPEYRRLIHLGGIRTILITPLRKDGSLLGVITAYRQEVRPFSDKEIALLQNFAAQAVIAMENARLLTETREALEQQTATAEVLQVINSSPGELAPVFDAILEKATRLCEAPRGQLATFDGEFFRFVAVHGDPGFTPGQFAQGAVRPEIGVTWPRIVGGERAVHLVDVLDSALYRDGHEGARRFVDVGGGRTLLTVALCKDDVLLGALTVYRQEVRPFTDQQITLVQNFAAQAVIAMENARLITETREALEQQTATAEVLGVINSSPGDLAPVFDAILKKTLALCAASFGDLSTYAGEQFLAVATRGFPPALIDFYRNQFSPGPKSYFGQLVNGEDVLHIADMAAEFSSTAATRLNRAGVERGRALVELGNARTGLFLALRKDDVLLGATRVFRQEVQPFTDKQIALVENFAAQAVIAMENARLITETREALEQQTATAEVLGVINSSPGDLAPVFDAMLEKAMRLCEAAFGLMSTLQGQNFHNVARRGVPTALQQFLMNETPPPGPHSVLTRILGGDDVVHVQDLSTSRQYLSREPRARAMVDLGGARSYVVVALRKDSRLLGTISAFRQEVRPFSDKQIALLQNFAAQAVIAMENARLLTETREALEQQTATAEVLQVINSSPGDLAPVFDAILEKALRLCGAAHGHVFRVEGDLGRAVAACGEPEFVEWLLQQGPVRPTPGGILYRMMEGERVVQIPDSTDTEGYRAGTAIRELIDRSDVRTTLGVALRNDSALLGAIFVNRREVRPFSEKEIALLENFAAQAVIAIENARLLTETREALEQQTATAEVLQVINSSPGDLAPVFDAILEKAHTLCGAALGGLLIYDGEEFRPIAIRVEPRFAEYEKRRFRPPREGDAPFAQLLRGARIVHLPDVRASDAYRDFQFYRDLADRGGIRTLLIVALHNDEAVLGAISAYRQEVRPFTDKQIALLQNFAAQAVIAMENARLLGELRQRTEEVAELNRGLEARVAEQVEELGRVGRLKRFLAPQLAELIVSQGDEKVLESHRREIVVVFCDLRGYTAFTETAEPEEVLDFLREYHGALGPLVSQFEGTLDQFSGDGIMVFFNDPVPCPDPAERAVNMAVAMREAAGSLIAAWRERGRDLGFGAGIAQGYATLGQIGFSERSGYTAIGTVCNVAARLCAEAKDAQILLSQRVNAALKGSVATEQVGALALKGFTQPVVAYNVPLAGSQAALRVIEGGAPGA